MGQTDDNGDIVGSYATYVDTETALCTWCNVSFNYKNQGRNDFQKHARGKKHRKIADGRMGRLPDQPSIASSSVAEEENVDNPQDVVPTTSGISAENNNPQGSRNSVGGGNGLASIFNGRFGSAARGRGGTGDRGAMATRGTGRGGNAVNGNQATRRIVPITDQVTKAETIWALKVVESNYSFKSQDNMAAVLRKMSPDNLILQQFTMMRGKCAAVIQYGLATHYKRKLVAEIKMSPAYTLGTDSATFKQRGLSKHVDYVIRYWSNSQKRVCDRFLDFNSLGKEPADVQVRHVTDMLRDLGIPLPQMLCLSRDNPNVMKAVFAGLERASKAANNPALIDAPCYLHPTHNAFKAAATVLAQETGIDVFDLLDSLYFFFKLSTARREDVVELRKELMEEYDDFEESLEKFYLRHIITRWLESIPCLERLLELWTSTREYFVEFIPNADDQNNRRAANTEIYQKIVILFSDTEVWKTKALVKFLIQLGSKTQWFLKKLQTERPQIHCLQRDAVMMFESILSLVLPYEKFEDVDPSQYGELSLDEDDLHSPGQCGYIVALEEEIGEIDTARERKAIRKAMRTSTVAMIEHLKKNLPFDNSLLQNLAFLDPEYRGTRKNVPRGGTKVAKIFKRFTEAETTKITEQLGLYDSLPRDLVPKYDKTEDRLDTWWMEIIVIIEERTGDAPKELTRLVKMCFVLSHGQGMVERGFSHTKWYIDGRNSMKDDTVKGIKITKGEISKWGGADKVPITMELLNSVKFAMRQKKEEEAKEKERKEREERDRQVEAVASAKRKRQQDELRCWQKKKEDLEEKIRVAKDIVHLNDQNMKDTIAKGLQTNNGETQRTNLQTISFCQENIRIQNDKLGSLNKELQVHMGKKPRHV